MRQAGGGVFPRHRASEPEAFLHRHVGGHTDATDGRTASGIVDDDNGFQCETGPANMDNPGRPKVIREAKHIFHGSPAGQDAFSRSVITARRKRAAMPPVTAR